MERVTLINQLSLVLEQDFILQVRRLARLAERTIVLDLMLTKVPGLTGNIETLQTLHAKLTDIVVTLGGSTHPMTNGDVFIILPAGAVQGGDGARLLTEILPAGTPLPHPVGTLVETYTMPADYTQLRERLEWYIKEAKELEANTADDPARNLQSASVSGPLTPYALSQLERLLPDMDIKSYMLSQRVVVQAGAGWGTYYDEYFVSMTAMQKQKFPRLDVRASLRLFAELGAMLDKPVLSYMLTEDGWRGAPIGLNLAPQTVLTPAFAQFCHIVTGEARHKVTFEIDVNDIISNLGGFATTVKTLRSEGFRVAIDRVTPDLLPWLNIAEAPVDNIKINVAPAYMPLLADPKVVQALRHLPPDKLIFMHVETAEAVEIGRALGVSKFQGFFFDRQ